MTKDEQIDRLSRQLDLANSLLAVYGIKYDETNHIYIIPSFDTRDCILATTESLSKHC